MGLGPQQDADAKVDRAREIRQLAEEVIRRAGGLNKLIQQARAEGLRVDVSIDALARAVNVEVFGSIASTKVGTDGA